MRDPGKEAHPRRNKAIGMHISSPLTCCLEEQELGGPLLEPAWPLLPPSVAAFPLSPGTLVPGGQGWSRKQGSWLLCGGRE